MNVADKKNNRPQLFVWRFLEVSMKKETLKKYKLIQERWGKLLEAGEMLIASSESKQKVMKNISNFLEGNYILYRGLKFLTPPQTSQIISPLPPKKLIAESHKRLTDFLNAIKSVRPHVYNQWIPYQIPFLKAVKQCREDHCLSYEESWEDVCYE